MIITNDSLRNRAYTLANVVLFPRLTYLLKHPDTREESKEDLERGISFFEDLDSARNLTQNNFSLRGFENIEKYIDILAYFIGGFKEREMAYDVPLSSESVEDYAQFKRNLDFSLETLKGLREGHFDKDSVQYRTTKNFFDQCFEYFWGKARSPLLN